jgi:polyisoprenyl-phosphate glycosyltransferase
MTAALEVSVVVPLYRTADTVGELHRRLAAALDAAGLSFEVVLVDDACPTGSGAAAHAVAERDPRVRVVSLERNRGQHAALLTGLACARGQWAVVLDGDLQDPPEAVPLLVAEGRARGAGAVFAGRRGAYESRGRLLTSRLYKRTLARLAGVPPDAGLFVAVRRPVVEQLLRMGGRRPSLVAMLGCTGASLASVPVERAPRVSGTSGYGALGRLRVGWRAVAWTLAWKLRRRSVAR